MAKEGHRRTIRAAVFATGVALAVMAFGNAAVADCPRDAAGAYADARRAFDEKRFDDSVALLRRAYACDPKPVYLGNVARTYEEANRPQDALAAWREYLAVVVDARERTVTEGRVSALTKIVADLDRLEREKASAVEAQRKAEAEARARRSDPPPSTPTPSRHLATAAWITAAAGAGGLVTGGVLGILANSRHDAAVADPNANTAASTQSDARSFAHAANWAFGIGGAVLAVGITWSAIDLLRPAEASPSAPVALVVSGTSVTAIGSF